ncbi:hypothetical protein Enr13x_01840 [Stieleria neptunia]|uniref:Uncharacterized protein n=1 Tax=Stieleria neptunia TaxID=2527979 RepID=A0A518HHQ9_9BACT|nr:hypothetical protein Enr13x_01840 [Stieleria neptunia]
MLHSVAPIGSEPKKRRKPMIQRILGTAFAKGRSDVSRVQQESTLSGFASATPSTSHHQPTALQFPTIWLDFMHITRPIP